MTVDLALPPPSVVALQSTAHRVNLTGAGPVTQIKPAVACGSETSRRTDAIQTPPSLANERQLMNRRYALGQHHFDHVVGECLERTTPLELQTESRAAVASHADGLKIVLRSEAGRAFGAKQRRYAPHKYPSPDGG